MNYLKRLPIFFICISFQGVLFSQTVSVSGELKTWHKLTININGPETSEMAADNPFLNYKLSGIFSQGDKTFTVPGYFAADGDAANTSATAGSVWKVHFSPPTPGVWNYTIRFRSGNNVAIADAVTAGEAVASVDNSTGSITIKESDKTIPDLRAKGRLEYTGDHYLRFSGNGEWFIKAGPDSPENLLAYADFDNTPNNGGRLKSWSAHIQDWNTGDPVWQDGKGKGLIGALNYLSAKGMNTISFLSMNIQGDDRNVYPYLTNSDYSRIDCSKMDQWEIIFSHAETKGIHLHFKLQETENELVLDNGALGTNRKLYYRELIARFGHHLAISWNLGEESGAAFSSTNQTDAQRIACSRYFESTDPYRHHVDIHTGGSTTEHDKIYTPLLGDKSALTGASMQMHYKSTHSNTKIWVNRSANTGKKWVVAHDEQGGAQIGVPEDGYIGDYDNNDIRKYTLWGNLMASGAGVEYYFGYERPHSDLTCQDFRFRDASWNYCKHALDFFNRYLPYWEMKNMDGINSYSGAWVLGKESKVYAVYFDQGKSSTMDLPTGNYTVKWYNPRTGEGLVDGTVTNIAGGNDVSIGTPPDNNDWVALVRESDFTHPGNQVEFVPCAGDPMVLTSFNDFPFFTGIKGYVPAYKDNTRKCLAINAANYKGEFAAAKTTYNGPGGIFNIRLNTLLEYDGESTYRLRVDGLLVGEYQNPRTDHEGDLTPSDTTWEEVVLTDGSQIQVEFSTHTNGLIPEGDGTAYSRGRWESLEIIPLCVGTPGISDPGNNEDNNGTNDQVWIEKNGILVVDVESLNGYENKNWALGQGNSHMGNGYLQYSGSASLGAELEQNRLVYKVKITNPGDYEFIFRVKQPSDATTSDGWNDSWVNIKADNYFGIPSGQSFATGTRHSMNKPVKAWIQNRTSESFTWKTNGDYNYNGTHYNGTKLGCTFEKPGIYEVHISGRSNMHMVDRFALAMDGKQSEATSQVEESDIIDNSAHILVDRLEMAVTEIELSIAAKKTLIVTIRPENATNKELIWTSSDPSIVAVSNGEVTGIGTGVAAITVRSEENGSINKVVPVIVTAGETISEIVYEQSGIIAYYADSEDTEQGMAVKENAVDDNPGTMWHTQWFSVAPPHDHEIRFDLGQSRVLDRLTYYPRQDANSNGVVGSYEVYVSDDSTNWGSVAATGAFTWADGQFKEPRNVEFNQAVTGQFVRFVAKDEAQNIGMAVTSMAELYFKADFDGVHLNAEQLAIGPGETGTLEAEIVPVNDTLTYPVTWTSSNEDIATVQYGRVTGMNEGVTWIVASILEGLYADTCLVHVGSAGDTLISFPVSHLELPVNSNYQLEVISSPDNLEAIWSSDNEAVVTVDANGRLSTHSTGPANITAMIEDDRYIATLGIEVLESAIHFDVEKDTLLVGTTIEVAFTLQPAGQEVTWTSSDPSLAFVSGGTVVARARGDVQIIASVGEGSIRDTLEIHVYEPYAMFPATEKELLPGADYAFVVDVFPDTSEITWTSDDESIATVSQAGVVSALRRGTALISASIGDGLYSALCIVQIINPDLEISDNSLDLQLGNSYALTAIPFPDTCAVSWISGAPEIVSVSELGVIEALSPGTATITASILGGAATKECIVHSFEPGIAFPEDTVSVVINTPTSIDVTALPGDADITWISLDDRTVSFTNGSAVGLEIGTVRVVATIMDGAYRDTCIVKVIAPAVTITPETVEIYVGNTARLTAFVFASGFSIEWISSDPQIASVTQGQVKGIRDGTASIRAQIAGGLSFDECFVTVMAPEIDIPSDTVFLNVNESYNLTALIDPSGYTVAWDSEDDSIVSVKNGKLTAESEGNARVFASVYYGFYSDSCLVVVSEPMNTGEFTTEDIQLYPVPTSGILHLKSDLCFEKFEVINMQGQTLKHIQVQNSFIDISDLEKGIYIIKLHTLKGEIKLKKVILQ